MNIREILTEKIERTGQGDTAVVGWGRGMGHKGHMMLASSVITHAQELQGDPYFVVSRTVGKDDPIYPDEKLAIYKKVFPKQGHIFQTASDEVPDLTKVLGNLNQQGYRNAVVIVGADQVKAFQYLKQYNGKPDKGGNIAFNFDNLEVISRQETRDPSREEEGPRATPMRQVLLDPTKSEEEQFELWRNAMSSEIGDDEVKDLMNKAKERMLAMKPAPKKPTKKKKPAVSEVSFNPINPMSPVSPLNPASPLWVGHSAKVAASSGGTVSPETVKILFNVLTTIVSGAVLVGAKFVADEFMDKARRLSKGKLEVDTKELKDIQRQIKTIYNMLSRTKKPETKAKYEQMLKDAYLALDEIKLRTDMKATGKVRESRSLKESIKGMCRVCGQTPCNCTYITESMITRHFKGIMKST